MSDFAIARAIYRIRQTFRYAYPAPIHDLEHRLIVAPPFVYGDQRLIVDDLTIGTPIAISWHDDDFGNRIAILDAARIELAVELNYEATVERIAGDAPHVPARLLEDARYRQPSELTFPSTLMREVAASIMGVDDGIYARALRINDFVAAHMRYAPDATSVLTTAAEAFALAAGVCQDYAHIMVSLARACGFAARYVSGHLIGEGGTHAWVEILAPASDPTCAVVWAFDPTHARRTNLDYVFIAAGRDFTDVTPTSGRFVAPFVGEFTTSRSVDRLSIEYAA